MAALGLVATAISAIGTVAGGIAQNNQAQFEAKQQEAQGREDFAASQRQADQARLEAKLANSRQQALAAASGGGAADPTIVKLMGDTAGQGEYNAGGYLYQGKQQKRGLFDQAAATRISGQSSLFGSFLGGAGQIAGGLYKYGYG
jgi:hypothetical protein